MVDSRLDRRGLIKRGVGGAAAAAVAAGGVIPPAQATARNDKFVRSRGGKAPLSDAEFQRGYLTCFASLTEEVSIKRLRVEGSIPRWLSGTYVRNGFADFDVGRHTFNHLSDGLAMLHRFSFRRGAVSYANRFLRSSQFESAREEGRIAYTELATEPPADDPATDLPGPYRLAPVPNANLTVKRIGRKAVALTEYPPPVVFDPKSLKTLGVDKSFGGKLHLTTSHPQLDPRTGELVDYQVRVLPSAYVIRSFRNGAWRKLGEVPVDRIAMLRPSDLLLADKPLLEKYRWVPDRGTRFIVIDRAGGRHVATLRGDPFFTFHVINAHDAGSRLTIDLAAYEDSSIFDAMYLPRLRGQTSRPFGFDLETRRCTLDLSANKVRTQRIGPGLEFPRIDYSRLHTRPYRYVYGASLRDKHTSGWFDQITKLDTTTGRVKIWRERGCYPGEAFFVRTPGTTREDDGVLLSVVVDGRTRTSFLLVLDARTLEEVGRALVPHHIPFGLHGEFFAS
jgi:beta,beta-carotene 9',10'-dioxygenase